MRSILVHGDECAVLRGVLAQFHFKKPCGRTNSTMKRRLLSFVVLSASFTLTCTVHAQDAPSPPVDKSGYSLFNPVPDDKLRDFSPDRPGKAHSATTVDAGHFQIETDFLNYTFDPGSGSNPTTRSYSIGTPVFKVGITNSIDFEVATALFNHLQQTGGSSPPFVANGFGDTAIGAKVNVFGNDSGDQSLAILPFVKLPTAASGIGNGYTESTLNIPDVAPNFHPGATRVWRLKSSFGGTTGQGAEPSMSEAPWPRCGENVAA